MISLVRKSDNLGAIASFLCLIHCVITPFLFIAQTCSASCCSNAPSWWQYIDYTFLLVSLFAVFYSAKTTSKKWLKPALWLSWGLLFLAILGERLEWFPNVENPTILPAIMLIVLHLYNRRYCSCQEQECCTNTH